LEEWHCNQNRILQKFEFEFERMARELNSEGTVCCRGWKERKTAAKKQLDAQLDQLGGWNKGRM